MPKLTDKEIQEHVKGVRAVFKATHDKRDSVAFAEIQSERLLRADERRMAKFAQLMKSMEKR